MDFRNSLLEIKVKDQILKQKMLLGLSLRTTTRVLGAMCQEVGAETYEFFSIIS